MVAHVVTDIALDKVFDYAVPTGMAGDMAVGSRVKVPFGRREVLGYVVELSSDKPLSGLKSITEKVGREPLILPSLVALAKWMADYYLAPFETSLKTVLPNAVRKSKKEFGIERLCVVQRAEANEEELAAAKKRAPKQAEALLLLKKEGSLFIAETEKKFRISAAVWRALEKRGLAEIRAQHHERDPFAQAIFTPSLPLDLNEEQASALASITEEMGKPHPKPVLLYGVTGSGKTEIYLQAIAKCLEQGKGAIVLVPEIALTPQSVERFKSRFMSYNVSVAVLHSHLSDGERADEWRRIREGRARVVIGVRSAVFAPVRQLGILVVDEEHETSYKQQEAPRYHARDVAVMRGHIESAAVVLGSATPSMESFFNAKKGKYALETLACRVDSQKMPVMHIVDMRHEAMKAKGPPVLSRRLYDGIISRLEKKEQVMLFLNRRGFSSSVICMKCGYVALCPRCSVSLTYHRQHEKMLCHLCGHSAKAFSKCPECGDEGIRFAGLGTEKIEQTVCRLFPRACIRRMDSDTMTKKSAYETTLGEFKLGKIDILVGTQMIAKGLHFPNVTLVGVIYADMALHMPDFRASERVFQLLTQVAGRAGRGDVEGEVFVQSYTPFHSSIQFAKRHDYDGFYEDEIEFRAQLGYPPCRRIILLLFKSRSEEKVSFIVADALKHLVSALDGAAEVSGGVPAPIAKIEDFYRYHILIKTARMAEARSRLRAFLKSYKMPEEVSLSVDVDPVYLM